MKRSNDLLDTKQKLMTGLIQNNHALAPKSHLNSIIMQNVIDNYAKDKKHAQLDKAVVRLEGRHREKMRSLSQSQQRMANTQTSQKSQESFQSDLESHLSTNQEEKQRRMKVKNEKSYQSLRSVEQSARCTQSSGVVRLAENHWGAIAKLNLYNMEKQHQKELEKIKGDKQYIKKELDVQIKERKAYYQAEKQTERQDEQEENRRTLDQEAQEQGKQISRLLIQKGKFKNNLDQQVKEKQIREHQDREWETQQARASLQKNKQEIEMDQEKIKQYERKCNEFFADRTFQITSLQEAKKQEMLRSRQEQREITRQWEQMQEEKEKEEGLKRENFESKVKRHQSWVGNQLDGIRVREKQVGKVIDKWEGISRNGIVAQAHRGELKYSKQKRAAQDKWNQDIVQQIDTQKQHRKLSRMATMQEARKNDELELQRHLAEEEQAVRIRKEKNHQNSMELNAQIKQRQVKDETIKDMNPQEILYNQRYLRQIQQLQNKTNSSFNQMFRRPSPQDSEQDI